MVGVWFRERVIIIIIIIKINGSQTVLVTKDQIGHFLKSLNVLGNITKLRIRYCNFSVLLYVHTSHRSGFFFG